LLEPQDGRYEDIDLARFNLLNRSWVHLNQFRQFLLGDAMCDPFAAHVCAEDTEFRELGATFGHALLGRKNFLHNTAQWGVIVAAGAKAKQWPITA